MASIFLHRGSRKIRENNTFSLRWQCTNTRLGGVVADGSRLLGCGQSPVHGRCDTNSSLHQEADLPAEIPAAYCDIYMHGT